MHFENVKNLTTEKEFETLIRCRSIEMNFGAVVNLRISKYAIEFDLLSPTEYSKIRAVEVLKLEFGRLFDERQLIEASGGLEPTQFQAKNETARVALELFNRQRLSECHETVEQIWGRQNKGIEREVQQGIILAASALFS